MSDGLLGSRRVPLVEVLDRVIDTGAVVNADALLGLADVDLIRVALRLVIAPADRFSDGPGAASASMEDDLPRPGRAPFVPEPAGARAVPTGTPSGIRPTEVRMAHDERPNHREGVDRGLAQLILTLVELLRELMDRQAVRRAMSGSLSDEQAERLGVALLELDERMDEVVASFGLDRRDLNLDLGPLGNLL